MDIKEKLEEIFQKKYNIFVAYHKPAVIFENEVMTPIHVGRDRLKNSQDEKLLDYIWLMDHMIGDNVSDNISIKNNDYCELSAIYWIWKNMESEYTGLMHYRRVFSPDNSNEFPFGLDNVTMDKLFSDCDLVLPNPLTVTEKSIYEQFTNSHEKKHLDYALDYIDSKYPEMKQYTSGLKTNKKCYFWNMFIAKKELFDQYSQWLFEVLFELENYITKNKQEYQPRLYGFISERLFNVYMQYIINEKGVKYKEIPVKFFSTL